MYIPISDVDEPPPCTFKVSIDMRGIVIYFLLNNRRVGVNADLSASNTNRIIVNKELDYSHFLYFSVSHRTNRFVYPHKDRYSKQQEETHSLIKSLHDSGLGYRKISRHLNTQKITTHKGKRWGVSGNSVHSVLKKHRNTEKVKNFR